MKIEINKTMAEMIVISMERLLKSWGDVVEPSEEEDEDSCFSEKKFEEFAKLIKILRNITDDKN